VKSKDLEDSEIENAPVSLQTGNDTAEVTVKRIASSSDPTTLNFIVSLDLLFQKMEIIKIIMQLLHIFGSP
jgi:hypothetical protein